MKKRYYIIIAVVLLLVLLIALAPVLLSSEWARESLVNRVNGKGTGKLAIQECSFGWRQGFVCNQVEFDDTVHGYKLSIPQISGSQGLLSFLVTPHNLGTIILDHPSLVLSPPPVPKGAIDASAEGNSVPDEADKKRSVSGNVALWDKFTLHVQVQEAEVHVVSATGDTMHLIHHSSADAKLFSGSVEFSLNLATATGEGTAVATGFINLPVRESNLLETMVAEVNGKIVDLQLKPFAAMLPKGTQLPVAEGKLSSAFLIKTIGVNTLQIDGTGTLRKVNLSGGFLGADTPQFEQILLRLDMKKGPEFGLQVPNLHVDSDVGTFDLTGNYFGLKSNLKGKGNLDLPELFRQFPHLTRMRADTSVEAGSLEVALSLDQKGPQVEILADGKITEFSGMQGRKSFSWDSPVTLDFVGSMGGKSGLQVKKADLTASFMHLEGKGELKDFTVHGTADLDKAVKEVGSIFELDWDAAGKVLVNATSREIGENHYFVKSRLDISDFILSHSGSRVLPKHQFVLTAQLDTPQRFPQSIDEAMNLSFDLSTWPGKINGKFDSIFRTSEKISSNFLCESTMKLGRLTDILHTLKIVDRKTTLTGTTNITMSGYNEAKKVIFRKLDSKTRDLIVHHDGAVFRDSKMHIFSPVAPSGRGPSKGLRPLEISDKPDDFFSNGAGFTFFDLEKHEVVVRDTEIVSGKGKLKVDNLAITNWTKSPLPLSLKADGRADFVTLTPVLQQLGLLPPEQTLAGKGTFFVDITTQANGKQKGTLQFDVQRPAISKQGKIVFSDEAMSVQTSLLGELSAGDIDFEQFSFTSTPLKVKADARLQRTGKEPYVSITGSFTPDYEALTKAVKPLRDSQVSAKGSTSEKFSFHFPLAKKGAAQLRGVKTSTTLQANSLTGADIVFNDFSMPITMQDGVFQGQLTGKLYESVIKLLPRIDFTASPPLFSLPAKEQLFRDVPLEQPLVDGVLKRVHPLLGELARPRGMVSGRLDKFSWPLATKGADQADFSLVLDVSKITLSADGILREIFNIVGFDDDILVLRQSEIICNGKEGRIQCTPLKILAADTEMLLSGSAGFDSSLDFVLEIPVTKKLVGTEGYRLLEGTTINIPIHGDSDNAVFDADILSGTIQDLLGQAAKNAVKKEVKKQVKKQVEKLLPGLFDQLIGN